MCREAGARVSLNVRISMNVRVQDMDLARPDVMDQRRLEIVADGLPLFSWSATRDRHHGCVSPQAQWDSTPHVAQMRTGLLWKWPEGAKRQPIPSWVVRTGATRLVVLGSEVSGRWSEECRNFPSQLAKAKVRGGPSTQGSRQASVALQVVAVQLVQLLCRCWSAGGGIVCRR